MDRHQAKEVLARYRPGETQGDTEMGEALELARQDPQLGEWFAKQRAAAADGVPVPDDGPPTERPKPSSIARPSAILGTVAVVVFAALIIWSLFLPSARDPFTMYRSRMARIIQRAYPLQKSFTDIAQVRDYFRTNSGPAGMIVPRNLEKLPPKGCSVFTWHGLPAGVIEFDGGPNTNLYLFVVSRAAFPDYPVPVELEFERMGKTSMVTWVHDERVYLLAGPDDPTLLKNYAE